MTGPLVVITGASAAINHYRVTERTNRRLEAGETSAPILSPLRGKDLLQLLWDQGVRMVNVSLGSATNSLFANGGTSLIVHEKADDMKTDPSGNSGARIACGTITK